MEDIDPEDDINPKGCMGRTPLHLATMKGHLEMCKMIINRITDINPIDDDKWSPLGIAYEHRHQELFKFIAAKIKEKV